MPYIGPNDYMVTLTRQSEILEKAHEDRKAGRPVSYWDSPEDLPKGPVVRTVTITGDGPPLGAPNDEKSRKDFVLDQIFFYGQNDHQPRDGCCSVSVGDVIHLAEGESYRVDNFGFSRIHSYEDELSANENLYGMHEWA